MRGRKTRENKARVDWEFGESQTSSRPLVAPKLISAGKVQGTPPYEAGFYRTLCVNTPYVDWLKTHVQEILETGSAGWWGRDYYETQYKGEETVDGVDCYILEVRPRPAPPPDSSAR